MRNHKRGSPLYDEKNTSSLVKLQMCFLLVYLLFLSNITIAIIEERAMIVIMINAKNNMYIMYNKYIVSIISLTSL